MKIAAWFNVIIRLLIVDVLLRMTALIICPVAYIMRKPVRWTHRTGSFSEISGKKQ